MKDTSDNEEQRGRPDGRRGSRRKRVAALDGPGVVIDYKNVQLLRHFLSSGGKLLARRHTGATAPEQRTIALAVRRARMLALLPFAAGE